MTAEDLVRLLRAEASDTHRAADHLDTQPGMANAASAMIEREIAYALLRLASRVERS